MFGPQAWRFFHSHLHGMHHGRPGWGHDAGHGYFGHHHCPSREEMIAHLERYQRDLEEEIIAIDARIKELRVAGAPNTPTKPGTV